MSDYHRYKRRDFDFAHLLVTLRKRARLTQEDVALHVKISGKAIRNWEGGNNYPSEVNLRKLIELYLQKNVFVPKHEQDEACLLWEQLHERTPHRIGLFDEQWFAALLQGWQASSHTHPLALVPALEAEGPRGWNEVLDVSALYGRTGELAELERWLLTDRCRLVAVLGMGGIGKTALTVKLVRQMVPHFDCVLWRSLHNAPSYEELLLDWLPTMSGQRSTQLPQDIDQTLALMIGLLQQRRCLLVLDNLETLFQGGAFERRYREGYEAYGMLIRRVAESMHRSCLVLACREKIPDLGVFTGKQAPVRVFRLGGLALPASQQMLQDKGIFGNQEAWSDLARQYAGNPLALKIVAETVHEVFGGDIAAFLAEGVTTFQEIRELLSQQFERLSELEQALMYWLAIEREFIVLEALRKELWRPVKKSQVMEAIYSLHSRSLVERGELGAAFTLQPVVLEYVTERLVELVSEEIRESRPALLLKYALLQGQAKDYIRTSQARLILQSVLDQLLSHFGAPQGVEEQFERLLQQLRALPRAQQGYGGGNLVNLLVHLNGHVNGKDCSHLAIWQANLQGVEAQNATFVGSDLTSLVFTEAIDGIFSVALSANGQYVAGGSINGQIHVWQVADGQPLLAIQAHRGLIWSLAFNPESTLLVSGGYDGLVRVWEVRSGQCLNTLQGHTKWIRSVAFHPAGKLLATCCDDESIRLWDLTTSRCVRVWDEQGSGVWSVAFSPDGQLLACGHSDGVVKLWDQASKQCLWSITAHSDSGVPSLCFSPDGALLVSGGEDARIRVWQTNSGEHFSTLSGHADMIQSLTFNTEGLLASGGFDRTVKLWKIGQREEAAQCLGTLQGHSGWIWSVAFGPEGLLASGSHDGVVKLWQIHRDGRGGKCLRTLHGHACLVNSVALSPDGRKLVSGEHNGTVRMWETKSGQCQSISSRLPGGMFAIVFSLDGRLFASSTPYKAISIWEADSGQCLKTLEGHQGEVWSVVFSPDGRFLLSGSDDTTVKWWDVRSGRCLITLQGHSNWVWSVACSPDGALLASGDTDGVIKLWDTGSGQCLRTLHYSPKAILALTFTPDGTTLLSSNAQGLVTASDVKSGRCLKIMPGIGDTYWLRSVTFSTDGSLLVAAGRDQTVKVWDVSSGEVLHTFPCHVGQPWPVALSADQRLLASGTDEGIIMLWERQTGKCLMTLRSNRPYERMNISGVTGITQAQKASLKALGAIEGCVAKIVEETN